MFDTHHDKHSVHNKKLDIKRKYSKANVSTIVLKELSEQAQYKNCFNLYLALLRSDCCLSPVI